jgi:hypothetical protein
MKIVFQLKCVIFHVTKIGGQLTHTKKTTSVKHREIGEHWKEWQTITSLKPHFLIFFSSGTHQHQILLFITSFKKLQTQTAKGNAMRFSESTKSRACLPAYNLIGIFNLRVSYQR